MLSSSVLQQPREKGAISFLWMRKQRLTDRFICPASHSLQGVGVAPEVTAHALKRLVLYVFIYGSIEAISDLNFISQVGIITRLLEFVVSGSDLAYGKGTELPRSRETQLLV